MNKRALLFLGLLVFIVTWIPGVVIERQSVDATGETSSGLGPSVDATYSIPDRFPEPFSFPEYFFSALYNVEWGTLLTVGGDYQALWSKDSYYFGAEYDADIYSGSYYVWGIVPIRIRTPYTDISTIYCEWIVNITGDGSYNSYLTVLYCLQSNGVFNSLMDDSGEDGGDSSYSGASLVVNGEYIELGFGIHVQDNSDFQIWVKLWYLKVTFNDVEETVRTRYDLVGGIIRYEGTSQCLIEAVEFSLDVPSDWTFQYATPNCTYSADTFSDTAPAVYTWVYSRSVLAIANWDESWVEGFEGDYTYTWGDYGLTSHGLEYSTVLDGVTSVKLSGDSGDWLYSEALDEFGECWLIYSVYIESGSVRVYVWDSNAWQYDEITTTGEWVTNVKHIADLKKVYSPSPHYTSILLYLKSASTVAYFDGLALYDSSVTTGSTITGQMNNIHPNGYVAAGFFSFEYNCTSWLTTNTSTITESDGSWSIDASGWSTTASNQIFSTWNPNDFSDYTQDTITYPWTTGPETTMHFSYYKADGTPLLFNTFKTYIDSERLPGETPWLTTTAVTVNLTVTDVWNNTVYQDTTQTVAEYIDVVTTSYDFVFTNQRDYSVNVTVNFNSRNFTVPDPIGKGAGFSMIFYTGNYTVYCWRTDTGAMEPGFPKSKVVSDRWEVYTERTIPPSESQPGSLTIIDPAWLPVLAILFIVLIASVYYDIRRKRS